MSLDIDLFRERMISYDKGKTFTNDLVCVYETNITHNLNTMAEKAGIYEALWRPYRLHIDWKDNFFSNAEEFIFEEGVTVYAKDIIPKLEEGLKELKRKPEYFEEFNPTNGWGTYKDFVPFVEEYLEACKQYLEAIVKTSR